jgi:hypothetical protein
MFKRVFQIFLDYLFINVNGMVFQRSHNLGKNYYNHLKKYKNAAWSRHVALNPKSLDIGIGGPSTEYRSSRTQKNYCLEETALDYTEVKYTKCF